MYARVPTVNIEACKMATSLENGGLCIQTGLWFHYYKPSFIVLFLRSRGLIYRKPFRPLDLDNWKSEHLNSFRDHLCTNYDGSDLSSMLDPCYLWMQNLVSQTILTRITKIYLLSIMISIALITVFVQSWFDHCFRPIMFLVSLFTSRL